MLFSYNVTKDSETIEYLNLAVIDRFIGCETTSSYQNYLSSNVKSPGIRHRYVLNVFKWGFKYNIYIYIYIYYRMINKSPGNRLSHLAKRRAIFSSASLAVASQKSSALIGRQVVFDRRYFKVYYIAL